MVRANERVRLETVQEQFTAHLGLLVDFWRERAVDPRGGFRTCFDNEGNPSPQETEQYLVSQTRVAWTLAQFAQTTGDGILLQMALSGARDIRARFWDRQAGGWFWRVAADSGAVLDDAKIVYGQSFAIYCFASLARITGDSDLLETALDTFDLLQANALDGARGGYYENFTRDWILAPGRSAAGDRKSLDIHTHLLEAFTELVLASGSPAHRRRLEEVEDVILAHMIDPATGAGGNQYALDFTPLAPIVIDRTWIAERIPNPAAPLTATVSYGHNVELGWLLSRADSALGHGEAAHLDVIRMLTDYALRYGFDEAHGGIYREGPPDAPASDTDKEFWQNCEALIGFLNAYRLSGEMRYYDAFSATWRFARRFLIHPDLGEWRTRTTRNGMVIDANLGNYWTGGYHTGRAAIECLRHLDALLAASAGDGE